MTRVVKVSKHGTITLPKEYREKYGIISDGYAKVDDTGEGIRIVGAEVVEVPTLVREAQRTAAEKKLSVEDIVRAVRKVKASE